MKKLTLEEKAKLIAVWVAALENLTGYSSTIKRDSIKNGFTSFKYDVSNADAFRRELMFKSGYEMEVLEDEADYFFGLKANHSALKDIVDAIVKANS